MRFGSLALVSILALSSTIPSVAKNRPRRHTTSSATISRTSSKKTLARAPGKHVAAKPKSKILGQRNINDDRATQIQAALIKAGYLSGTPTGHWDAQSEAAMQKVQADNGWQTKLVPDSRALIKLGLGPNSASGMSQANPPAVGESSTFAQANR